MELCPISLEHSVFAWHMYFSMHFSSDVARDLTYPFIIAIPATAASLTESFLPKALADMDLCENEVFKASRRFTTMFMNCKSAFKEWWSVFFSKKWNCWVIYSFYTDCKWWYMISYNIPLLLVLPSCWLVLGPCHQRLWIVLLPEYPV